MARNYTIEEINASINKTDALINKLTDSVAKLSAKFTSDLERGATSSLASIAQKITSLYEAIAKAEQKRAQLYEKAQTISPPSKELDSTIKAINSLDEKINKLYSRKASAEASGNFGIAAGIEEEIIRSERALSSFISRLKNLSIPSQAVYPLRSPDLKLSSQVPVVNKIPEVRASYSDLPDFYLETAYKDHEAFKAAQEKKLATAKRIEDEIYQATLDRIKKQAQAEVDLLTADLDVITGKRLQDQFEAELARLKADLASPPVKLSKKQLEEEKRLRQMQNVISQPRYEEALELAKSKNFTRDNLAGITEVGLAGIQRIDFQKFDELTGVTQKLRLFVNEAGRVMPAVSRQFNTFASSVARDIVELSKWTLAIGVIYGPLNKLNEMVTLMVENETRLANAMIAVSDSTLKVTDVFDIAAEAADAMGENVSDVIVNFSQAYQATGGMENAETRVAVATKLMNDALVLSKLSTLSAAESIDTLAAALRQAGMKLDQGSELLDMWVKTTRVANVDLTTLAVGFSVLGEQADSAGLSQQELNAILAVTSETLGITGREAANVARSFVSGFQSDKAVRALENLGIATQDTEGNMRSLLEIQRDLYELRQTGVLSPTQFSELSLAIGGGTRRAAAVAGFIESYPRISQIVSAQENVEGEAAKALAKRLDTVQTALTKLQNAFQSLAQTLGNEGGLLDLFSTVITVLGGVVGLMDKLAESAGKAGPALLGALAISGIYKYTQGPLATSRLASRVGDIFGFDPAAASQALSQQSLANRLGRGVGSLGYEAILMSSLRGKITAGIGTGILTSLIPALQNYSDFQQGDDRHGGTKAIANIVGGIAGGIGAAFIGQSPLIGAAVGSAIAESFVTKATEDLTLADFRSGEPFKVAGSQEPYSGKNMARLLGAGAWDQLVASWSAGIINFFLEGTEFLGGGLKGLPAISGEAPRRLTALDILYARATPEQRALLDTERIKAVKSGELSLPEITSPYISKIDQEVSRQGSYLAAIRKAREEEMLNDLIKGKITPTSYQEKMDVLGGFDEKSAAYFVAFGEQFQEVSKDINSAADAYKAFLDIFTYGSDEQITNLTKLATEIGDLMLKVEELRSLGAPEAYINDVQEQINKKQQIGGQILASMMSHLSLQRNPPLNIINQSSPIVGTPGSIMQAVQNAVKMQIDFLKQTTDYTDEEIEAYRESLDDFVIAIKAGGEIIYKKLSELGQGLVSQDFLDIALKQFEDRGLISTQTSRGPGFQTFDFPSSQLGTFKSWIQYYQNLLQGAGVPINTEPGIIAMFSDDQFDTLHYDLTAINLAQSKMVELQQKQLEQGMWNIPEGQSFWVPIQSYVPAGGGGGGGNFPNVKRAGEETTTKEVIGEAGLGSGEGGIWGGGIEKLRALSRHVFVPVEGRKNLPVNLDDFYPDLERKNRNLSDLFLRELLFNEKRLPRHEDLRKETGQMVTLPKLAIEINSTTTLQLDGKTVANVVKNYLAKDLIRTTTAYGKTSSGNVL